MTEDEHAELAEIRAGIDATDKALHDLIRTRAALSRRAQKIRQVNHMGRIMPTRETVIIRGYAAALGTGGPALAHALLRICRGDGITEPPPLPPLP